MFKLSSYQVCVLEIPAFVFVFALVCGGPDKMALCSLVTSEFQLMQRPRQGLQCESACSTHEAACPVMLMALYWKCNMG